MSSNVGKFIDRSPLICPAGKSNNNEGNSVASLLNVFDIEEGITAIKHDAQIIKEHEFIPPRKLKPYQNASYRGIFTQIQPILKPPDKTRYQTLIDDLKETTYRSYWNKEVGKGKDPTPALPRGMIPKEVIFGTPTVKETPCGELVNPPKNRYQVLWESQVGHEMYKKTHNDYNPSEQINRNYTDCFDPNKRYGKRSNCDPRGIMVRCCCTWYNIEPISYANHFLADHFEKHRPALGKPSTPCNNIECVPEGHRFGKPNTFDFYNVGDLLKDPGVEPCLFKRDLISWMQSFNALCKSLLRKKKLGFEIQQFEDECLFHDKNHTNFIPLKMFYDMCLCHKILFKQNDLEQLLKLFHVIQEDMINYKAFFELVNRKVPLRIYKIQDIPEEHIYFVTTYQENSCDYLLIDNTKMRPAGLPSVSDFDDVSIASLISPSIYTQYGLSYRDFLTLRPKETVRKLFDNCGYQFTDQIFDKMWKKGQEIENNEKVSVETFRCLLKEFYPKPRLVVDEVDCKNM